MPARTSVTVACAAAGALLLSQQAFVPAPTVNRRAQISAVAGSVATLGAAPAFADEIGKAAVKLTDASYPFLKEIDWNSFVYSIKPGSGDAIAWLKAIDKAIVMGTAMDSKLLKEAVIAHSNAIHSVDALGVTSKADYLAVNAAIGRIVASVPRDMVMDVYNAFDAVVPKTVPEYMMSRVKAADAKASYAAFMQFKDVVEKNQVNKATPLYIQGGGAKLAKIDAAASVLAAASYDFAKGVDWTSDVYIKPLPGATAPQILKAVDKALIMGASMDGQLLKEAGEAHHKAIESIGKSGVTSAADWEAINAAIGKLIATTPQSKTLAVFDAFAKLTNPTIPNNLFSSVNAGDAISAYNAFWKFKDVVAASGNR